MLFEHSDHVVIAVVCALFTHSSSPARVMWLHCHHPLTLLLCHTVQIVSSGQEASNSNGQILDLVIQMQPNFCLWQNLALTGYLHKNCHFKHTCNDDNSIGRRKLQKPAYHRIDVQYEIVTCKFPIMSL